MCLGLGMDALFETGKSFGTKSGEVTGFLWGCKTDIWPERSETHFPVWFVSWKCLERASAPSAARGGLLITISLGCKYSVYFSKCVFFWFDDAENHVTWDLLFTYCPCTAFLESIYLACRSCFSCYKDVYLCLLDEAVAKYDGGCDVTYSSLLTSGYVQVWGQIWF